MRIIHDPVRRVASGLLLGLCVLLLAGCPSTGGVRLPPSLDRAESLAQRGEHAGSAREFEALAGENPGAAGVVYQLRAAREYLAAQRADDAQRVLAAITPAPAAGSANAIELVLVRAELSIARGQGAEAWAAVASLSEPAERQARLRYLDVRQRAAFASARPIEGIRAEIAREKLLDSDAERSASRRELLAQLRSAVEHGVKLDPQGARDNVVRGWLELGLLASQGERATLGTPLANWRARYPTHPGVELARGGLVVSSGAPTGAPGGALPSAMPASAHVAVLLPLSGRTAGAAAQIRDGLLTALYGVPAASRPELRFYDTATMSVADAISSAVAGGAESIIGPLTREEVQAAADYSGRRPAILALNFLATDKPAPADFYQFALSPEDEARQVAKRALADGRRRAVALVPAGDWGTRVANAFRQELEAGGGQVLAEVTYTPGRTDYSAPIQQALRLSDSQARARRLESVLGTSLQFTPRRRGDIDFLFVPASAATARQLRPQLRFHFAGDIPAYTTSDSYEPNPQANTDLDGLMFPDMPWVLSAPGTVNVVSRVRTAAQQAWGDAAPRSKLFAFGYDAWQLATAIQAGNANPGAAPFEGLTGTLSFDDQRRVRRELNWAQLRGGNLRLLARAGGQ